MQSNNGRLETSKFWIFIDGNKYIYSNYGRQETSKFGCQKIHSICERPGTSKFVCKDMQ